MRMELQQLGEQCLTRIQEKSPKLIKVTQVYGNWLNHCVLPKLTREAFAG